ncbi:hypothetical protein BCT82_05470 [Vibrio breoganii]|uniref:hypothetical protein n=1 Tax=Vibrio breoganii TaxID=553239 RepID=UPI000C82F3F7|nr:hypothetical protein [Vibrio breoganii]PML28913.1 hypothetical protein BCT82_05470 [Vibrio breoganii]
MKYSESLENYYKENPPKFVDAALKVKEIKFVESVMGEELRPSDYDELSEGFALYGWMSVTEMDEQLSNPEEKAAIIAELNESLEVIKGRGEKAELLIKSTFSNSFVEELEWANDVLKEELLEYFEAVVKEGERDQALVEISSKLCDS